MKKLVLLITMMLAIAGVYAQGVDFTVNKALKKDYFKVQISITSGVAPFDITFNGRHLDQYSLFAQYDVPNIITITDANNTSKTDTIYETNPGYELRISYFDTFFTDLSQNTYHERGIYVESSFDERENFDPRIIRVNDGVEIGYSMNYGSSVYGFVRIYLTYPNHEPPVGVYAIQVLDTVRRLDTVVFLTIYPNDTTNTDTTSTDTTTTDTTQHLNIATITKVDDVEFYPNPTSDFCNTSEVLREVCIFSNKGDLVRVYKNTNRINLSGLPAGSYLIRYTTLNGKTTNTKKIIKE